MGKTLRFRRRSSVFHFRVEEVRGTDPRSGGGGEVEGWCPRIKGGKGDRTVLLSRTLDFGIVGGL